MPIDYYDYWSENKQKDIGIRDREKKSISFLKKIAKGNEKVLDVGCGSGKFLEEVKRNFPQMDFAGVDFSPKEIEKAISKGIKVKKADVEKKIPFGDGEFHIIYTGEVIEHLFNPDIFLEEISRCLKKNGFLILSTPNLAVWYNRVLMMFGVQPLFLEPSTKSKKVGAGLLKGLKKDSQPVGHVRIFTLDALKDLFRMNGLKIVDIKGAIYDMGLPKKVLPIDKIFTFRPTLSSHFVILAKKII